MSAQFLMSAPSIHHHLSLCPCAGPPHPPPPPLCCLSDRAVASVLQGGCPGEQLRGEEALGMHQQHYAARATNLREFPFFPPFFWPVCFPCDLIFKKQKQKHLRPVAVIFSAAQGSVEGATKSFFVFIFILCCCDSNVYHRGTQAVFLAMM